MDGDWYDLVKLMRLSGAERFIDMRIIQRCWDVRLTLSGRHIWSPRPMTHQREHGSFQDCLRSVGPGDVIMVFKGFRLKLVGLALNSQRPTSQCDLFSDIDLGGSGCYIPVEPLYLAPAGQLDGEFYDKYHKTRDDELSGVQEALGVDGKLSAIEYIRVAQASEKGLLLAHQELKNGARRYNWVPWIFPTTAGAISTDKSSRYRLSGLDEALLVLRDSELGPGYINSVAIAWDRIVNSFIPADVLMGSESDAEELRSSLELFLEAWHVSGEQVELDIQFPDFCKHASQLLDFINPSL